MPNSSPIAGRVVLAIGLDHPDAEVGGEVPL
jgi:hypothetical protein